MNCENEDSYKMKIIRRNEKVIMKNVQCMLGILLFSKFIEFYVYSYLGM